MTQKQRFDFTDHQQVEAFLAGPSSKDARFVTMTGPGIVNDTLALLGAALNQVSFLSCDEVAADLEVLTTLQLPALKTLLWCDSGVSDEGATRLASAPWAAGMRELILSNRANIPAKRPNSIGDEGARALAMLGGLERLDLMRNPVGDVGVLAIATQLSGLKELIVWRTAVTQEGATRFSQLSPKCVLHSDFSHRVISYSEG